VVYIARKFCLNGQILNGMLCGAAVGTGFASFETLAYILNQETMSAGWATGFIRGALSPFGHVPWSAITCGAYWLAWNKKRETGKRVPMQFSFWRIAIIPFGLHMLWNSPILEDSCFTKYGLCGLFCWMMVFLILNQGLIQVRRDKTMHF
jgi:RsiW-degrading membrane proteinase PrsW (M82 family)